MIYTFKKMWNEIPSEDDVIKIEVKEADGMQFKIGFDQIDENILYIVCTTGWFIT